MQIQRGDRQSGPTLKNHKAIVFLCNTGPDPLKNHKATKQHSMFSHHLPASETPFPWCFACGPMMARFISGIWILSTLINLKKNKKNRKKHGVRVVPPLTKLSGSRHGIHTQFQKQDISRFSMIRVNPLRPNHDCSRQPILRHHS